MGTRIRPSVARVPTPSKARNEPSGARFQRAGRVTSGDPSSMTQHEVSSARGFIALQANDSDEPCRRETQSFRTGAVRHWLGRLDRPSSSRKDRRCKAGSGNLHLFRVLVFSSGMSDGASMSRVFFLRSLNAGQSQAWRRSTLLPPIDSDEPCRRGTQSFRTGAARHWLGRLDRPSSSRDERRRKAGRANLHLFRVLDWARTNCTNFLEGGQRRLIYADRPRSEADGVAPQRRTVKEIAEPLRVAGSEANH